MSAYSFEYGDGAFELDINQGQILGEIRANQVQPLPDVDQAVREALAEPTKSPPLSQLLRPGDQVAIVVGDITRLWVGTSRFLPPLLDTINQAGIEDRKVTVILGNGDHRRHTEEEKALIVGEEVYRRVRVRNHYARNSQDLVKLGTTSRGTPVAINKAVMEADKVILTGGIVYHFLAGFGGGAKALSIGVAGYDTIQTNHRLALAEDLMEGLNPLVTAGKTAGNPLYEDLVEIMHMAKAHFLVNTVINHRKEIVAVVAGSPLAAHEKGCRIARSVFEVKVPRRADMAVASAMGYPEDIDLYQTYKTLDNVTRAVEPGGVIVLFSECREGMGNPDFEHILLNFPDIASRGAFLQENCTIGGLMGFGEALWAQKFRTVLYSSIPPRIIEKTGMIPAASPQEALDKGLALAGPSKRVWVMPHASVTFPVLK